MINLFEILVYVEVVGDVLVGIDLNNDVCKVVVVVVIDVIDLVVDNCGFVDFKKYVVGVILC